MNRFGKYAIAVLSVFALLFSACATDIGGARVTARVGTRLPGYIWSSADGEAHQIEPVDPSGDTLFFIVRGRY